MIRLFSRSRRPTPPPVSLAAHERLLAAARAEGGGWLLASTHRILATGPDDEVVLQRPWHLVDQGAWDHDTFVVTITWVDGEPPVRRTLVDGTELLSALRERIQASVVLAQDVDLGARRTAKVIVRQVLPSGDLVDQVILGAGARMSDPVVAQKVNGTIAFLHEQVGG